jgi:hypothetical protein
MADEYDPNLKNSYTYYIADDGFAWITLVGITLHISRSVSGGVRVIAYRDENGEAHDLIGVADFEL